MSLPKTPYVPKVQPPVEKVAPGIWSIPTVVPDNPIGWTQTYLIESTDGPYLVDAGWNHDRTLVNNWHIDLYTCTKEWCMITPR